MQSHSNQYQAIQAANEERRINRAVTIINRLAATALVLTVLWYISFEIIRTL